MCRYDGLHYHWERCHSDIQTSYCTALARIGGCVSRVSPWRIFQRYCPCPCTVRIHGFKKFVHRTCRYYVRLFVYSIIIDCTITSDISYYSITYLYMYRIVQLYNNIQGITYSIQDNSISGSQNSVQKIK